MFIISGYNGIIIIVPTAIANQWYGYTAKLWQNYVAEGNSLSHIKIGPANDFSLCFPHELLMSFLKLSYASR